MATDLNNVMLIGRLTADPELKTLGDGGSLANFSIACNKTYLKNGEKKENVSFFNCVAWRKLGEIIAQYCKKGDRIGINGRLQQETWQDQEGNNKSSIKIVVENMQFLTNKNTQENNSAPESDGEIPF